MSPTISSLLFASYLVFLCRFMIDSSFWLSYTLLVLIGNNCSTRVEETVSFHSLQIQLLWSMVNQLNHDSCKAYSVCIIWYFSVLCKDLFLECVQERGYNYRFNRIGGPFENWKLGKFPEDKWGSFSDMVFSDFFVRPSFIGSHFFYYSEFCWICAGWVLRRVSYTPFITKPFLSTQKSDNIQSFFFSSAK